MTWRCLHCLTTLTYTGRSCFNVTSVMMECPRCGKWMERAAEEPVSDASA